MTWSGTPLRGNLKKCCVLILGATIVGAALRLPRLAQRPMHGDEAVHAEKFGRLLEQGAYTYDPKDYHGPTLNYFSLIPAWLSSAKKLTEVTEFTLRMVPIFFGLLLVVMALLISDGMGRTSVVCAAALTAVSPVMVFYSRYYIMEILLVCFTFGAIVCGYRYVQSTNVFWAVLTGGFLGLMHATKETCIIAFGSMLVAVLLTRLWAKPLVKPGAKYLSTPLGTSLAPPLRRGFWHFIAVIVAAAIVSSLFYSSFFTNTKGILDSFWTYATYFSRAGNNRLHIHPWYYYLKMLLYFRYGAGPAWSEAFIMILAVAGFIVATTTPRTNCAAPIELTPEVCCFAKDKTREGRQLVLHQGLLKFIAFYTLIMTVAYSVIPYKTPWCMLGPLHGMILLAGVGAAAMIKLAPNIAARSAVIILLIASGAHLAWQAYLANYVYYADSRNPYVYAHPTTEVFTVARLVEEIARVHPDGHAMHIQVICPGDDYWPLPWYLRSFTRVEYRDNVDVNTPAAPVIIASPSLEAAIAKKLYEQTPYEQRQMYMPLFDKPYYVWLRPKVELTGWVRKDIWQLWQGRQCSTNCTCSVDSNRQ